MGSLINKNRNWLILPVLIMFLILAYCRIGECKLWIDEVFSISVAQRPLSQIWNLFSSHSGSLFYWNTIPPLYETILHFLWHPLVNNHVLIARSISVFFTIISLYFLFLLARLIFDDASALIAVLLASLNYSYVFYAKMIRGYALLNALSVISLYLFFKIVKHDSINRKYAASIVIVNTLILYTFYFGIFVIIIEMILALLFMKRKRLIKIWLYLSISLVLFIPWIKHVVEDMHREVALIHTVSTSSHFLYLLFFRLAHGIFYDYIPLILYLSVVFHFLIYSINFHKLKENKEVLFIISLITYAVVPVVIVNLLALNSPEAARARYSLNFLFPLFILAGAFIRKSRRYGFLILVVLLLFSADSIWCYFKSPIHTFWPAELPYVIEDARKFPVKADDKIIVEVEDAQFLSSFLYYFYSPKLLWEARFVNNNEQLNSILGALKIKHRVYYNFAKRKEYHWLHSMPVLTKGDWLFLVYSNWHEYYWGKSFEYFYEDRLRENGLLSKVELAEQKSQGGFSIAIYKVIR